MLYSLDALIGSAKAFINLDLGALMNGAALFRPPERTVIEVLESVEPTAQVIAACQDLCDRGYTLALDDFVDDAKWTPLTAMAKYLKIDFRISQGEVRAMVADRYLREGLQLLAEKVETQEDQRAAQRLGYTLFQGYFFCKPNMVEGREVPPDKTHLHAFARSGERGGCLSGKAGGDHQAGAFAGFKLLRYLNSPHLGLRTEIRSIHHAITLLGDREFRRWVTILAVVAMGSGSLPN
jgi:c-di-GMP-related signal transduction protein